MDEIRDMVTELLIELDGVPEEQVESIRTQMLEHPQFKGKPICNFLNVLFDTAIKRNEKKAGRECHVK